MVALSDLQCRLKLSRLIGKALAGQTPKCICNDKGFTLLELIISLALISLIVVFLSGGFKFGRRVWETTESIHDRASLGPIQNYLRSTLSRARPIFFKSTQSIGSVAFIGDQNRLQFVANQSGNLMVGGVHIVEFLIKEKRKFVNLEVRQHVYRRDVFDKSRPSDADDTRILIENAKKVRFRYYGAVTPGGPKDWHTTWRDNSTLPNLVGINLEFTEDDPRKWPELIVELRLAVQ